MIRLVCLRGVLVRRMGGLSVCVIPECERIVFLCNTLIEIPDVVPAAQ